MKASKSTDTSMALIMCAFTILSAGATYMITQAVYTKRVEKLEAELVKSREIEKQIAIRLKQKEEEVAKLTEKVETETYVSIRDDRSMKSRVKRFFKALSSIFQKKSLN